MYGYNEIGFSEFKEDITVRTVPMEGGRVSIKQSSITTMTENRNTRRSKNNRKSRKTKRNIKYKKMSEMSEMEHFRARMSLPIGTSTFGIPLTSEMIEENDDATTADVVLQTVFFEDIIFG
jgi:hypothetical protein